MEIPITRHLDTSTLPVQWLDEVSYRSKLSEVQAVLKAQAGRAQDAVIHGTLARLHTECVHWRQFWSANWFAPDQWASLTGEMPPSEPKVHIYAIRSNANISTQAYYSREHNAAFLIGDAPYGGLRTLTLGAVARLLAEEEAVHLVPGICLERDGQGGLLLSAPEIDWAKMVSLMLQREDVRLITLDGVFIRYGLVRIVDGVPLLPTLVIDEKGNTILGYHLFPWLDTYGFLEPRADARCLTLDGQETYCFARDLDLGRAPESFAYPLEQAWYVPTALVAVRPHLVDAFWRKGRLENVPPLTEELRQQFGAWAIETTASLKTVATPALRALWEEEGEQTVVDALCRLRAAPQGRAIVPPEQLWPDRAGRHPCRPIRIERVELLRSAGVEPLPVAQLPECLAGVVPRLFELETEEISHILNGMLARASGSA